jgi:hypothetical protein
VLHDEIGRLPEAYRAAVVLCDLEGLTQEQAARQLGWPPGTVRSRLSRGRGRLQARLTRRGLAPSAAAAAALLHVEAATAGVPAALAEVTIRAAAGRATAGVLSAATLAEGVLRAMFMTKLKWITAASLAIVAGAGGTAVPAFHQAPGPPGSPAISSSAAGEPRGPEGDPPRQTGNDRPPESPALPDLKVIEGEIALAESNLKRAEDRLNWACRMFLKGYISRAQLVTDVDGVDKARSALSLARAKQKMQGEPSREKTAEERKRDEVSRLSEQLESKRIELERQIAQLAYAQARKATNMRLRARNPGLVSEGDWKLSEAEVAVADAECNLKRAELKLLELRLDQAKQ